MPAFFPANGSAAAPRQPRRTGLPACQAGQRPASLSVLLVPLRLHSDQPRSPPSRYSTQNHSPVSAPRPLCGAGPRQSATCPAPGKAQRARNHPSVGWAFSLPCRQSCRHSSLAARLVDPLVTTPPAESCNLVNPSHLASISQGPAPQGRKRNSPGRQPWETENPTEPFRAKELSPLPAATPPSGPYAIQPDRMALDPARPAFYKESQTPF
jgi:hypothetical protein